MANTKEYLIRINGLEESINAVESLNKQLDSLDKKIAALQGKAVNVSAASSGGGGGSRTSELSDEDKLLKQIEATQSKINQADMADYKILLDKKQELKELVKEQKSMTAEARLSDNAYNLNTMQGMKEKLADIKAAMQTTDIRDTDTFSKLTKDANELNSKLLEIEKSYGQFGRQVGNYEIVAEGFKGLKITVGDTVQEFENARQAYMTLKREMQTLSTKQDMGIISPEETERLKSLIPTVKQLESSIQDAGKPMDNLMDTMQSIVALASAGKGLAAFFGLENTGVEESIKKLVALQNVLTSFQTIQKQLQTEEGLGKYFSKGSKAIDNFVSKLLGVKTASVQAATAEKTATVATNQLATASKGATLAVKGLSTALKAVGIGLLIGFISSAVDGLSNLFKKTEKGKDAIDALDMSINALNRSTENMMQMYDKLYDSGSISRVEKLTEQYKLQAEYVENIVEAMRQRQAMDEKSEGIDFGETFDGDDSGLFKVKRDIEDVREEWEELQYNITNGIEEEKLKINVKSWLEGPKSQMDELNDASKQLLNDFVGRIQKAEKTLAKAQEDVKNGVAGADEKLKEAKKTIKDLEAEMNNDRILNSVIANLDKIIPDEGVRNACQSIFNSLHMISTGMDADAEKIKQRMHDLVIGVLPEQQQALARAKEQYEQDLEAFKNNLIGKTLATVKYNQEVDRINSSGTTSGITTGGAAKTAKDIENEITAAKIRAMREGLTKTIAQLTLERNRRIEEIKKNGRNVGELTLAIESEYQNKVLQARLQFHQNLLKAEEAFKNEESSLRKKTNNDMISLTKDAYNRRLETAIDALRKYPEMYDKALKDMDVFYSDLEKEISKKTEELGIKLTDDEELWSKLYLNRKYITDETGLLAEGYKKAEEVVKEGVDDMYNTVVKAGDETVVFEQTLTERLDKAISDRLGARKKYYERILQLQKENAKKQLELQKESITNSLSLDLEAEEKRFRNLFGNIQETVQRFNEQTGKFDMDVVTNPIFDAFKKYKEEKNKTGFLGLSKADIGRELSGAAETVEEFLNELEYGYENHLVSFEDYNKTMQSSLLQTFLKAKDEYENYMASYNEMSNEKQNENIDELKHYEDAYYAAFVTFLDDLKEAEQTHFTAEGIMKNKANEDIRQAELEYRKKVQADTNAYFSNIVNEYENGYAAIARVIEGYQTSNRISSEYGFINLKALRYNINSAKALLGDQMEDVNKQLEDLEKNFKLGLISEEDYDTQLENFTNLKYKIQDGFNELGKKGVESVDNLVNTISNYIQTLGNAFQTIMDANNTYQDYLFDKQQEDIDRENDELQKKLNEQEEILQKHKSAVDSIEDELSSARGDRRQHLIDQLNEEIRAERQAAAEKKQIEKQQEALQKKQDELDKQRKKAEYNRNLQSILVSGAMAAANGYATQPFIPVGLAMGTLAASLAAYQYAMAKKAKPFATGGVIVGKAHKDGGVPVLGGQATVEGGEFITNKRTTAQNTPLLEYINSKKKRIDLSDMVEFFNDKPRATIKNIRSKFADGGKLALPNVDLNNFNDRTIIVKDEGVYQVQVVDVINKAADVKRVQVLAGLNPNNSI